MYVNVLTIRTAQGSVQARREDRGPIGPTQGAPQPPRTAEGTEPPMAQWPNGQCSDFLGQTWVIRGIYHHISNETFAKSPFERHGVPLRP